METYPAEATQQTTEEYTNFAREWIVTKPDHAEFTEICNSQVFPTTLIYIYIQSPLPPYLVLCVIQCTYINRSHTRAPSSVE
jgi:hypothetical protein